MFYLHTKKKSYLFACNMQKIKLINFILFLLQVSCLWQGQYLLSVSLSGFINYLDVNNPNKHIRILKVIQMLHCPVSALNLVTL
jgi:hypothetical protein